MKAERSRMSPPSAPIAGLAALGVIALVAACSEPPPTADAIATYRGGSISIVEAENMLRGGGATALTQGSDELIAAFRRTTEASVLRRTVLEPAPDLEQAVAALGDDYQTLRDRVVLELTWLDRFGAPIRITPEEVAAHYRENRERYRQPGMRNLRHIFRRDRQGEDTRTTLEALRVRALEGEGFADLARQYSDSETRLLDGRLGWIGHGRLPKAIEDAVFALEQGAVSDVLPVRGGASLFYVSEVVEARDFPLEDVAPLIVQHLRQEAVRARRAELVEDLTLPEGSRVVGLDALPGLLANAPDDEVLLEIGDFRLTAGALRSALAGDGRPPMPWEPTPRTRLENLYEQHLHEQLLVTDAERTGFVDQPETRARIEERLRQAGTNRLVERALDERIDAMVDGQPEQLERFHRENRFLYQSPLRLHLRTLAVPADQTASDTMAQLEALRTQLVDGEIDLVSAALEVGGSVQDQGWVDFETLMTFEPKVRFYVLELNGTGYTIPFQLNRQLNLVWVEEREEPNELAYEEVREQVRQDYRERNHETLREQAMAEALKAVDFAFHEAVARRALATPSAAGPAAEEPDAEASAP